MAVLKLASMMCKQPFRRGGASCCYIASAHHHHDNKLIDLRSISSGHSNYMKDFSILFVDRSPFWATANPSALSLTVIKCRRLAWQCYQWYHTGMPVGFSDRYHCMSIAWCALLLRGTYLRLWQLNWGVRWRQWQQGCMSGEETPPPPPPVRINRRSSLCCAHLLTATSRTPGPPCQLSAQYYRTRQSSHNYCIARSAQVTSHFWRSRMPLCHVS